MRKLIENAAGSTPSTLDSRGELRSIPDDLLREASRRLGIMALLGATLWIVGTVLIHVVAKSIQTPSESLYSAGTDAIAAVSAALSLGLFFYSRGSRRDPCFILDLGLIYMVVTALALSLTFHWNPIPHDWPVFPMISWIGVVVVMFAAIVPAAPRKVFAAGFLAATMNPLAMLLARARGTWNFGHTGDVLLMHYPDYLLVGVAVVIAHVHTRLGRRVAKEREMGSYRLGELLGRGGMGEVYRATHRMLARPAAIKLIRPEVIAGQGEAAQMAVQRFRREADAAARLRSPHTVEIYDFGVTAEGTLFFVMEFLEGSDLQSLVRAHGAMPAARVIHILRQVCHSLAEAHARGLVHRDIKPANIHLGIVGLEHDFVKVLDFGLVKSMTRGGNDESLASAAGITPGTPAYIAPEIALGSPIDARSDIYSVGCVAYFLLTGGTVFEADTVFQIVAMTLRDEPVPPSRRTSNPIPIALERLVLGCLAKDPNHRPQSALELQQQLAALDIDAWTEEQGRAWWADHETPPVEGPDTYVYVRDDTNESAIVTALK